MYQVDIVALCVPYMYQVDIVSVWFMVCIQPMTTENSLLTVQFKQYKTSLFMLYAVYYSSLSLECKEAMVHLIK